MRGFLQKCVMCQVKLKCRILLKTYKNRTKQERAHKSKYDMTWKVLTIKIYDEIGQVTYVYHQIDDALNFSIFFAYLI